MCVFVFVLPELYSRHFIYGKGQLTSWRPEEATKLIFCYGHFDKSVLVFAKAGPTFRASYKKQEACLSNFRLKPEHVLHFIVSLSFPFLVAECLS